MITVANAYPRIDAVINSIKVSSRWDKSISTNQTQSYCLRAAMQVARNQPFTDEETVLNEYLQSVRAGPNLCEYAWRLYAQSL